MLSKLFFICPIQVQHFADFSQKVANISQISPNTRKIKCEIHLYVNSRLRVSHLRVSLVGRGDLRVSALRERTFARAFVERGVNDSARHDTTYQLRHWAQQFAYRFLNWAVYSDKLRIEGLRVVFSAFIPKQLIKSLQNHNIFIYLRNFEPNFYLF